MFNHKKYYVIIAAVIFLLLSLYASKYLVTSKNNHVSVPTTEPSPQTNKLTYTLGVFTFSTDTDYVYPNNPYTHQPVIVETSEASSNAQGFQSVTIGGISSVWFNRKLSTDQSVNPLLELITWKESGVRFPNNEPAVKNAFSHYMNTLKKLNQYIGKDISFLPPSFDDGFNYPLAVEKITDNRFDEVYFSEAISGNGEYSPFTVKYLILHKGEDWMVIFEEPKTEGLDNPCVSYMIDSPKQFSCVMKAWKETYRDKNKTENQQWIEHILSNISVF